MRNSFFVNFQVIPKRQNTKNGNRFEAEIIGTSAGENFLQFSHCISGLKKCDAVKMTVSKGGEKE